MCLRCHSGIWELFFWKRREFNGAPQTDLYDPWVFTGLLFFSNLTWKAAFNAKCTLFYGSVEHRNVCLSVLLWDWNNMMSENLGFMSIVIAKTCFSSENKSICFSFFKCDLSIDDHVHFDSAFRYVSLSQFSKTFKMFLPTVLYSWMLMQTVEVVKDW